jgi:hypothetical protein
MTALKVIAVILMVVTAIKLVVVLANPRSWIAFARRLYLYPAVTSAVALVLAAIVFYFLLASGMTIVQILAVCVFVVLLLVMGMASYSVELFDWLEQQDLNAMIRRMWLYTAIWLALLAWGAVEILFS